MTQADTREVYSSEVPELLVEHQQHLQGSGLDLAVIRERGYRSITDKTPIRELGFSGVQQRPPGLLIPLWGVKGEGVGHQFRPDHPRERGGKPIKYETPKGATNHLDIPPRCQAGMGDPKLPLWITEGAKKADALAARGACAVDLPGVWGWRGRNDQGGITISAEWDHIAVNGRVIYLAFDSDVVQKPSVRLALLRLAEHMDRKQAQVWVVLLPADSAKTGIDDYLAQGHSLDQASALAIPLAKFRAEGEDNELLLTNQYVIRHGSLCHRRIDYGGKAVVTPLANFTAWILEDVIRDDGVDQVRSAIIEGAAADGRPLPAVEVPASSFDSLLWVRQKWGFDINIEAGSTSKDRLRSAIIAYSARQEIKRRSVFTRTGWLSRGAGHVFLTGSGALGTDAGEVDVDLEEGLSRYQLPLDAQDVAGAMSLSLDFLSIAPLDVTLPLWGAMYLAPLCPFVDPAFSLWLVGPSGSLKSTLAALALSHYGQFTEKTLPAAWKDTANYLERRLFLSQDVPLVIDDFSPGGGKDQEFKAEIVDRAQGNRSGRGRLRSDLTGRARYYPRGVAISTGEDVPAGQSHLARILVVEMDKAGVNLPRLSAAQQAAARYPHAMAGYILWLAGEWDRWSVEVRSAWQTLRDRARGTGHLRIPDAIACLYLGCSMGLSFAVAQGVLSDAEAEDWRRETWERLLRIGEAQSQRVEGERPVTQFVNAMKALLAQGRIAFGDADVPEWQPLGPGIEQLGWRDDDMFYFIPGATFNRLVRYYRDQAQTFPVKERMMWQELERAKLLEHRDGRLTEVKKIGGVSRRVYCIPRGVLEESAESGGGLENG